MENDNIILSHTYVTLQIGHKKVLHLDKCIMIDDEWLDPHCLYLLMSIFLFIH